MKTKITVLIAATLMLSQTANAKTRLIVNCFWPSKHHVCTEILPDWISEVKRVTDGRVTGIIPPKSVAAPPEQLSAVESGIADVSIQFNGLIQNRVSGPMVAMQPFVGTNNAEAMSKALWETNRKFFPNEFDSVHLLSQFVISPGQLFSQTDKPIVSYEDFSSRKIWSLPGTLAVISKASGAGVVSSPAAKSNEIISRGVVDGHFGLDAQAVTALQLTPYTKSLTSFKGTIFTSSFSFFINKDKWAEISSEDQKAIMEVSGSKFGAKVGASWDKQNEDALVVLEKAGVPIVEAEQGFEEKLAELSQPITTKWLEATSTAGIDGAAALEFYKKRASEISN